MPARPLGDQSQWVVEAGGCPVLKDENMASVEVKFLMSFRDLHRTIMAVNRNCFASGL